MNRNVSGIRATWLEAAAQIVNQQQLAAVEDSVRNQGTVIDSYGDALATKVNADAVPTIAPLSQTINRRADPTFQLSDFMAPPMSGTDSRGDTVTVNPSAIKQGANANGTIYYSFITPLINRAYEQLNFMVSEVSSTPARMDVAIYTLDPATKLLTQQVLVEDAAAGLSFNESVVTITFDRWIAEQGSYVCIAWLQHGTGEVRSLLGLDETQRPLTDMVFPPKISAIGYVSGGYTALPATVDGSSTAAMDFPATWFTPYAELSESISIVLRQFQDPFTSDGQYISRPWVELTSKSVYVHSDGWAGVHHWSSVVDGFRAAIYETPLATDRVRIDSRALNSPDGGDGAYSIVAVRTTNNMTEGVGVFYGTSEIQIRSWSAGSTEDVYASSIVRASTSWPLGSSRDFHAVWMDEVLTVYDHDDTVLVSWTDTITTSSPNRYRFAGIGFLKVGGVPSPRLDHWVARDLPAVEQEEAPAG